MMSKRPRRNHSPAFKAKVVLAAIKGDRTVAQLSDQFDIHPNQVATWKAQLEGAAAEVFGPGGGGKAATPPIDVKALHGKIGELTSDSPRLCALVDRVQNRLDILIDLKTGGRFPCCDCSNVGLPGAFCIPQVSRRAA
jgi:transposase-like protein